MKQAGFTLVELLTVIAIIGMLSSIIISQTNSSIQRARSTNSISELTQARNAVYLLTSDTGLWPNGCPPGRIFNPSESGPETPLDADVAGLVERPPVVSIDSVCGWNSNAVNLWNGPYMSDLLDPWGNPYWFDPDYETRRDCPTPGANPLAPTIAAIVSLGPNGTGGPDAFNYDCDDIYLKISDDAIEY